MSPAPAAQERPLNLIDSLTRDAVASDYALLGTSPPVDARRSRRQHLIVAGLGLALAGFVLATGLSNQMVNRPVLRQQREALLERVEQAEAKQADLATELEKLRAKVVTEQELALKLSTAGQELAQQVSDQEVMTGYSPVKGPGARVTLSDAAQPSTADSNDADLSKVLDSDLQDAVNGLWRAGAEAISINGQRLGAQSAIRSAAGAILINYRPLRPPYVISAVGPKDLDDRFAKTPDAAALHKVAKQFGIGLQIQSAGDLELPAVSAPLPDQAHAKEGQK